METPSSKRSINIPLLSTLFVLNFSLLLYELLLTKIFNVILFGPQAHLAIALALLGGGLGAALLYFRPTIFSVKSDGRSLQNMLILFAISIWIVLLYVTYLPLTFQSEIPPETFQERSLNIYSVVNTWVFVGLLPILCVPFAIAGILIAGIFRDLPKESGLYYSADLLGAAIGSLGFILILTVLPATDALLLVASLSLLMVLVSDPKQSSWEARQYFSCAAILLSIGLLIYGIISGREIFPIHYAAGFSEDTIIYNKWTPLTRVSIFKNPKNAKESIVLDNGSASPIVVDKTDADNMAKAAARALVYTLSPVSRAAVIGASAGPDVAAAIHYNAKEIHAIDVAGAIFPLIKTRYKDREYNPYLHKSVLLREGDGRTVIYHDPSSFDVIQIVHANLWSLSGILSNVWSPTMLETKEAFLTYLDKLTPDGTLSIAKGWDTMRLLSTLREALIEHGAGDDYWRHIAFLRTDATVLLVKKRPWTNEEREQILQWSKISRKPVIFYIDPLNGMGSEASSAMHIWPVMTDDKPYSDVPIAWSNFERWAFRGDSTRMGGKQFSDAPLAYTYSIFMIQVVIVVAFGFLLLFLPLFLRWKTLRINLWKTSSELSFAFLVGFGFIGVEIGLISSMMLLVSQPVYLVSGVLFTMLSFAGLGSLCSTMLPPSSETKALRLSMILIPLLGVLLFFVVIPSLLPIVSSLATSLRVAALVILVAPLAFLMGFPMPLAIRYFTLHKTLEIAPWMWSMNCWASVCASFVIVAISRFYGYSYGMLLSLCCYLLAAVLFSVKKNRIG